MTSREPEPPAGADRLTPRERQCLELVARHYTSKQISARLGLSPNTVDEYVQNATRRLGARDRFAAARLMFVAGALSPSGWGAEPSGDDSPAGSGHDPVGKYGGRDGEPGPDGDGLRGDATGGAAEGGDRPVRGPVAGAGDGGRAVSGAELGPGGAPD